MPTEWLRVMLDEVERKRREAAAAKAEAERRAAAAPARTPRAASR
jgi:hypothetical protein